MSQIESQAVSSGAQKAKSRRRWINYTWIVKNIPFMLYLAILAILYIYNGHYADNLTRSINRAEKNVRDLHYQYKNIKSEVIFRSKPSELIKVVEPMGLKELKQPAVYLSDTTHITHK